MTWEQEFVFINMGVLSEAYLDLNTIFIFVVFVTRLGMEVSCLSLLSCKYLNCDRLYSVLDLRFHLR